MSKKKSKKKKSKKSKKKKSKTTKASSKEKKKSDAVDLTENVSDEASKKKKSKTTKASSSNKAENVSDGALAEMNYGQSPSKTTTNANFSLGSGDRSSGSSTHCENEEELLTPRPLE